MSPGSSGVDALGIAIRSALACEDDMETALGIAADHGGDTATSTMVCGQLLGALHGPTALPSRWVRALRLRNVVERMSEDAATEFGPQPSESQEWGRRYLNVGHTRSVAGPTSQERSARRHDRFLGAVLGCAVGEALGAPITSDSWDEIRARHGEKGLGEYVPAGHPSGRLGSDTQIVLFSLEGTVRAGVDRRRHGANDPTPHIQHAYQRWLHTQHLSWSRAAGEFLEGTPEPDGWLVDQRALFQTRNPGRTMMRTLIAFAKGQQPMGTPENPVSDSKGSSAVMRAVPTALWSEDPVEVFRVGASTAALTHGSPPAFLSAGALGYLVSQLIRGEDLRTATDEVLEKLADRAGNEEVSRRVTAARRLADGGAADPVTIEANLGSGWTAPEALGIGLHAALASKGDFDTALATAVNHSGNSATTGAVCASLMGAALGAEAIPERWLVELELREVIEWLVHDAGMEFGPEPPEETDWFQRYPPT